MATAVPARIELTDIEKSFGGVHALRGAALRVEPGTVHALVGENGAGKSTLIKMIAGLETPDAGIIQLDGQPVSLRTPADAMALGIRTVYQEPELVPELTVTENIFLGREITSRGRISWREQAVEVHRVLGLIGFPADRAALPLRRLTIAEQQQVAIAKAVADQARVLILDEPSAILTDTEIQRLFGIVRKLTATGVSVIYITHRLDEVFEISDAITVMRDGRTIRTVDTRSATLREVIQWMVGDVAVHRRTRQGEYGPVGGGAPRGGGGAPPPRPPELPEGATR